DGHHRSAAASRIAKIRGGNGKASHDYFLSVIFPHHQMTILDYNRLLRDLNGRTPEQLVGALDEGSIVMPLNQPTRPTAPGEFSFYLAGQWRRLTIKPGLVPASDPIGRLPITILTKNAIEPLFGITNPRTDKRIDFLGGARGLAGLEQRVASGEM